MASLKAAALAIARSEPTGVEPFTARIAPSFAPLLVLRVMSAVGAEGSVETPIPIYASWMRLSVSRPLGLSREEAAIYCTWSLGTALISFGRRGNDIVAHLLP